MIQLSGVSKSYGSASALHPIDLDVHEGEFLTLLGPSGSGKSTLLNLIAGATEPSGGSIHLAGRDISRTPPRERGIGMVFQNYALMPHMTVFDNVAFPLRARGEPVQVIRKKVAGALARVGLRGFESRKPRQLSGGQQQRVGIARCLVYSPSIIMMDEPLGALDKNLREQMQGEIKRLHQEVGTTIIYVTHDQEEAMNMSDRICLMSGGRIEQLGTPDELYFQPRSRFVAEFIGDSNLIGGHALAPGRLGVADGLVIAVPERSMPQGAEFVAMIRPENVRLVDVDATDLGGSNVVDGKVARVTFVGGMTRVNVELASGLRITAKAVSGRCDSRPAIGARVRLCWSPADTVLLES